MWVQVPKIVKSGNFSINLPLRGESILKFLQNFAWGSESQVSMVTTYFTIVGLEMWAYCGTKLSELVIIGINLSLGGNPAGA